MGKRLVAIIRKHPEWATQFSQYATGDPVWKPQLPPDYEPEPDHDYLRKRELEDRIVNGYTR